MEFSLSGHSPCQSVCVSFSLFFFFCKLFLNSHITSDSNDDLCGDSLERRLSRMSTKKFVLLQIEEKHIEAYRDCNQKITMADFGCYKSPFLLAR